MPRTSTSARPPRKKVKKPNERRQLARRNPGAKTGADKQINPLVPVKVDLPSPPTDPLSPTPSLALPATPTPVTPIPNPVTGDGDDQRGLAPLVVSNAGLMAFETFLRLLTKGVPGAIHQTLNSLRSAQQYSDVFRAFIDEEIDQKSLLTLRAGAETPLPDGQARDIRKTLEGQNLAEQQIDAIIDALRYVQIPRYRIRLREIEEITKDIDATRMLLRLVTAKFPVELKRRYEAFATDLDRAFVKTNETLVKQLATSLTEFSADLMRRKVTSMADFVLASVDYVKKVIAVGDQREILLKTVRSSIQRQLDPKNTRQLGLTSEFISREHARFSKGGTIDEAKCRAIYMTVNTMLLTRYDNSELFGLLDKHDLRDYAEVHGRLMEHHVRLMNAAII